MRHQRCTSHYLRAARETLVLSDGGIHQLLPNSRDINTDFTHSLGRADLRAILWQVLDNRANNSGMVENILDMLKICVVPL